MAKKLRKKKNIKMWKKGINNKKLISLNINDSENRKGIILT